MTQQLNREYNCLSFAHLCISILDLSEEAHRRRLSKFAKPFGQMYKYLLTADRFHLSDDQTRKIVSKLNRYVWVWKPFYFV